MVIDLKLVSTSRLIAELERRQREEPGGWNAYDERRIAELAKKLNPEPINP